MPDTVNISSVVNGVDLVLNGAGVNVTDPVTNLSINIVEETVDIKTGVNGVQVTDAVENIGVTDNTDNLAIAQEMQSVLPNSSDVIVVQPMEDAEMPYAKRVDFENDDTLIYRGEAAVGSANTANKWRVRRLTIASDDDVTEEWANGNASFDKVWDDRLSFNYY